MAPGCVIFVHTTKEFSERLAVEAMLLSALGGVDFGAVVQLSVWCGSRWALSGGVARGGSRQCALAGGSLGGGVALMLSGAVLCGDTVLATVGGDAARQTFLASRLVC